jgi:hypothetical protein
MLSNEAGCRSQASFTSGVAKVLCGPSFLLPEALHVESWNRVGVDRSPQIFARRNVLAPTAWSSHKEELFSLNHSHPLHYTTLLLYPAFAIPYHITTLTFRHVPSPVTPQIVSCFQTNSIETLRGCPGQSISLCSQTFIPLRRRIKDHLLTLPSRHTSSPSKPHTQPLSWPRPSSSRPRSLSFSPSSSTPFTQTRRSSSES